MSKRVSTVDRTIRVWGPMAEAVKDVGGVLRCTVCGREEHLGDIAHKLRYGWPMCHGYTMRWVTQRQLEEAVSSGA